VYLISICNYKYLIFNNRLYQIIKETNIYHHFIQMNHISKVLILFLILNITSMIPPFIIFYKRHKDLANNIIVQIPFALQHDKIPGTNDYVT